MVNLQKITALADLVDRLDEQLYANIRADGPLLQRNKAFDDSVGELLAARARLVRCLAHADNMLVGTEYCNECGEVEGVVTKVEREPNLIIFTTAGDVWPGELYGSYFRLPGSDAYGECALVELARQRVANAAAT